MTVLRRVKGCWQESPKIPFQVVGTHSDVLFEEERRDESKRAIDVCGLYMRW